MSLAPGRSLLHFRLVEKVGEGGMGEVWRAVDTTLDREVAIKVPPAAFAADTERLARFEREAKVLASLNHPNIAAVYGFPEAGGVRFLAMEMVRGEDLAEILTRGPLPLDQALDAARQIASALEAAHDHGVIHRDLKPANVMRTPEGQIKVLDFGLAKALQSAESGSAQTATITSAGSQAGTILGTASYMSPEQARGQVVDRRTDLWAFGCVLFEMLTGERAFGGATVTDVLAAVVRGEPDWDKIPQTTPASVRRLLRRCLEKDPRKRLRDAGDASLLLDDHPEDARAPSVVGAAKPARSSALALLAIVIASAALATGWWLGRRGAPVTERDSTVSFTPVTFARGMMRSARFAPDGRTIVYGAAWGGPPIKLYLARTDSPEAAPIPLPPGELFSISRSGEMAVGLGHRYYGWVGEGTLARTSVLGGGAREIAEHVRAADWSPDGAQLAIVRRVSGEDHLEYPVGTVLARTSGYFADVRVSPDGEHVAFADHPSWGDNRGNLAVVDRSGKQTTLAADFAAIMGVAWAPGGREVWFTALGNEGSAIRATDLAGHSRVVYGSVALIELFDIASDGRVLLANQRSEREATALMAGASSPRALVVPGESSVVRTISPDGRAVLVANQVPKDYETFLIRSDQPGATRLGTGESVAISPDGQWATLNSADFATWYLAPLGMGPTRTIPNAERISYQSIGTWLLDSKRMVVVGRRGADPSRAYVLDVTTGAMKPFGPEGATWPLFSGPPVSPDGRYAVIQDAAGTPQRYPLEGGEPLPIPGLLAEDQLLTWSEDGAALFVARRQQPIPIERLDLATGRRTPWITVAPSDISGIRFSVPTITPNGKYWTLSAARVLSSLYVVEGLR
jgi:eukaryotic-like serine/threonine-protein kinase